MRLSSLHRITSLELPSEHLEEFKERAKATNCSLNNYVESILTDITRKYNVVEENMITPDLQAEIDKAKEDHKNGKPL